jgi:hypothetical protein
MPRILAAPDIAANKVRPLVRSLDDLRREPGRLIFIQDIAALGIAASYDGVRRLVETGKLPVPYMLGKRPAWEGRAILQMLGTRTDVSDIRPEESTEAISIARSALKRQPRLNPECPQL